MGSRRVAALAVAGWLAVVTVACGPARQDAPPAVSGGSEAARAALAEAYTRSLAVSRTVEAGAPGFTSRTSVDPVAERGVLSLTQAPGSGTAVTVEARRIAGDTWIRVTGMDGIDPDTWMRVDSGRTLGTTVGIDTNDTSEALMRSVIEVRGAAPLYTGTLISDLAAGGLAMRHGLAGPAATTVPFTATVDDQGRVTSMTMEVDAGGRPAVIKTTFSGFGVPVSVTAPPAADVVEGTDEMLSAFGIN